MKEKKEVVSKDKDVEFFEEVDAIMEAYLSNKKMIQLNERTFRFAQDILDSHHILVNPLIARNKEIHLIAQLLNCSETKAIRIRNAHTLIWGDSKGVNDEFQKRLIAEKLLKFAQQCEFDGELEKSAELYEKYYIMRGFDKEVNKVPRQLPKLIILSSDPSLLESQLESEDYE